MEAAILNSGTRSPYLSPVIPNFVSLSESLNLELVSY